MVLSLTTWSNVSSVGAQSPYPMGVVNPKEPSGMAPPPPGALPHYHMTYVNDFNQSTMPKGWYPFNGPAGGIASDIFNSRHILFHQGLLQLKTYRDPRNHNRWTTSGLCQCGHPFTYGAVFVRSRETGPNVNSVQLLWPSNNQWPPEIDFNESLYKTNLTTETVHWVGKGENFHILRINLLAWHTWGVIWTPHYILFTVDGHPWHEFAAPSLIPHLPMRVDFEQRVNCPSTSFCPTKPSAMQIDWIAEFGPD